MPTRSAGSATAALLAALAACDVPPPAGLEAAAVAQLSAARPTQCEAEAVLLVRPLLLRQAPDPAAADVATLPAGTWAYRCGRDGAFLGIMFPEQGGPVDCSVRPVGQQCPVGWTDETVEVDIAG